MQQILKLAISDFKLIFRDPSIRPMLILPIILFVVFIWVLPDIVVKYEVLKSYLYVFLMVGIIENTQMFCFISSMVLIDEKETDVAKVYGVVPLSKRNYIISRLIIPFVITVLLNIIFIAVQPFYSIDWLANAIISILSGLIVPIYVLGINSIVTNRMQGMIYIKAFNIAILLPLAAYFLPANFKHIFGFIPSHWIFISIEKVTQNSSIIWVASIAFVFLAISLVFVSKQFIRKHFI